MPTSWKLHFWKNTTVVFLSLVIMMCCLTCFCFLEYLLSGCVAGFPRDKGNPHIAFLSRATNEKVATQR